MDNLAKTKLRGYELFVVITMFWAYGFVFIDRFALSMLFPQVAPDLQLNNAQMGMSMAVLAFCWGVSSWVFASLSDIFRAKKLFLVACITAFSLMCVLTGLVHSFTQLLIVRAIMGIAEGPVISLTQAITMAESHPLRRGANMGFVQGSSALAGMSFCAALVIALGEFFGWRSAFGILAVPTLILAFLIWRFIREPRLMEGEVYQRMSLKEYAAVFKNRNVWVCFLMGLGVMGCWLTNMTFQPIYLANILKFSPAQISTYFVVAGVLGFFGLWVMSMVSDKIGRKPTAIVCALVGAGSVLLFMSTHSFILIILSAVLFGIGSGQAAIGMAIIPAESVPKASAATAIGVIVFGGEIIAGTIVPSFAGRMADLYGLTAAFMVSLAFALLIFVAAFFLKETAPAKVAKMQKVMDSAG